MRRTAIGIITAIVVVALFLVLCTFRARKYEVVLLDRFGTIIQNPQPILYNWYFCLPTDKVVRLDTRLHVYPSGLDETTMNGETIAVRTFAVWHITDPKIFYTRFAGNDTDAQSFLNTQVRGKTKEVLSSHRFDEIFNAGAPATEAAASQPAEGIVHTQQIEEEIKNRVNLDLHGKTAAAISAYTSPTPLPATASFGGILTAITPGQITISNGPQSDAGLAPNGANSTIVLYNDTTTVNINGAVAQPTALKVGMQVYVTTRDYGMEITEIGFSRFAFAANASARIYDRMSAERQRLAKTFIDEGNTQSAQILADSAAQATVIVGQAKRQAEEIKAKAENDALDIIAAMQQKPYAKDLYEFWRSLELFKAAITKNTVIILTANDPIMKFFGAPTLIPPPPTAATRPSP